jgi:hypothetical protein
MELPHEQLQLRLAEVEASCKDLGLVEEVARMWKAQLATQMDRVQRSAFYAKSTEEQIG